MSGILHESIPRLLWSSVVLSIWYTSSQSQHELQESPNFHWFPNSSGIAFQKAVTDSVFLLDIFTRSSFHRFWGNISNRSAEKICWRLQQKIRKGNKETQGGQHTLSAMSTFPLDPFRELDPA